MSVRQTQLGREVSRLLFCAGLLTVLVLLCCWWATPAARAAEAGPQPAAEPATAGPSAETDPEAMAEAALAEGGQEASSDAEPAEAPAEERPKISVLKLFFDGGPLMYPILLMSMLVVALGVERGLALRRHKILPPELVGGLGRLAGQKGGFDPRQAYRLCQQFPSTAANVIKIMLLKIGRPHSEVEHAVHEANDREAAKLYANVRWLNLAAAITPLLGLLGTVQGMIIAFYNTATLPTSANKATALASGIYVALVTTFAGLSVAIPAALLAHLFEGRIQKLLRELDETLLGLTPQLERFEGRLRVSKEQLDLPEAPVQAAAVEQPSGRQALATPK
jgi:biopolymer transport protein ExbB